MKDTGRDANDWLRDGDPIQILTHEEAYGWAPSDPHDNEQVDTDRITISSTRQRHPRSGPGPGPGLDTR